MTSVPQAVTELVERFSHNFKAYHRSTYNETQVRVQFIDPFFEALGWDVHNRRGVAPRYQDVVHEAALHDRGGTKAPDYSFRVGAERKFFVEAKKPAVDIRGDTHPAYQLRRYGWTAKLCLSVLTDFEEFSVYDCRYPPKRTDKAGQHRILYIPYQEYADRWDEVASVFSKEAVWRGDFDAYCQSVKAKRGTQEVDEAFLKEIEGWRGMLARNIALRNPNLTVRDLNYAVQQTLDRIIFLRICEDRGIEPYEQLKGTLNGEAIYGRLMDLFHRADDRYNSGLFHFRPEKGRRDGVDTLTPSLQIDDKVLRSLIDDLYYPQSPYEFSVLGADILGNVYEQFLGSTIRLTPAHRAKVEPKPEVRKAGGVYYTPKYIVDYIVEHTVGKLCGGKTPGQISELRILDPACGSGSFLLGAYAYLLDYHLTWYVENPTRQARKEIYQGKGGEWFLTTEEKKRILLNNVYGVDIDSQAVEVTKLSLLLRVLEDENEAQMRLWQERALPDLADNIKCGNSLIGTDFCKQASFLTDEEMYRVNPFDWESEFPEDMGNGGFDAVIGNPPYVRSQSLDSAQKAYFNEHYKAATATYDIYVLFVERSLDRLMNPAGRSGFILPNKFFTTDYGKGLRQILVENKALDRLVDFEDAQIFTQAGTYTTLMFLSRQVSASPMYARLGSVFASDGPHGLSNALKGSALSFESLVLPADGTRWTLATGASGKLLARLQEENTPLETLESHVFQGLKTSADKVYVLTILSDEDGICQGRNGLGEEVRIERELLKPVVKGEHVKRYHIDHSAGLFIVYPYQIVEGKSRLMSPKALADEFPLGWEYLRSKRRVLGARDRGKWGKRYDWYAYARSQNIGTFIGRKLLVPYMATRLRAAIDQDGQVFFVNITTGGYGARITDKDHSTLYYLGILNSVLMNYCVRLTTNRFRGGYFAVNKQALDRLPIRAINFSDSVDVARHDRMVELVERMLALHKELDAAKTPNEKNLLQRQIDTTDRQIDQLVYELYGSTDEEIEIVEGR